MTVYVYGEKAQNTHENKMLESFINAIKSKYEKSSDWIYLIANSFWGNAEIDCVCITKNSFIVIDFKDYSGSLAGTENNTWIVDNTIELKGGVHTNPFQQLRYNKYNGVILYLQDKNFQFKDFDYSHIQASVIFKKLTQSMQLSGQNKYWFFITDLENSANLLTQISSPKINLEQDEVEFLIKNLGVNFIKEYQSEIIISPTDSVILTEAQEKLLEELKDFVESDNLQVFLVLGATQTGKTILLERVRKYCEERKISTYLLAPNKRIGVSKGIDNIYGHIYNYNYGNEKIIPTKTCNNSLTCIYFIDDAHILNNNQHSTYPYGIQNGSGKILEDLFFDFLRIVKQPNSEPQDIEESLSKRKVIFFADPYQIKRTKNLEDDFIFGNFFKKNNITYKIRELEEIFTVDDEVKLNNILNLITAIKNSKFSELHLETSENFRIINDLEERKVIHQEIVNNFKINPQKTHYLAWTEDECKIFTKTLRRDLFDKNNLAPIENNELVEIIYDADNYGFSEELKNYNFSYNRTTISPIPNKKQQKIKLELENKIKLSNYHIIPCINDNKTIHVVKEFLTSDKPLITRKFRLALKNWTKKNREKLSLVRYAYANTIKTLQGLKKDYLYINCNINDYNNEDFFRWLYTAITIGKNNVLIKFNFKNKANINDNIDDNIDYFTHVNLLDKTSSISNDYSDLESEFNFLSKIFYNISLDEYPNDLKNLLYSFRNKVNTFHYKLTSCNIINQKLIRVSIAKDSDHFSILEIDYSQDLLITISLLYCRSKADYKMIDELFLNK